MEPVSEIYKSGEFLNFIEFVFGVFLPLAVIILGGFAGCFTIGYLIFCKIQSRGKKTAIEKLRGLGRLYWAGIVDGLNAVDISSLPEDAIVYNAIDGKFYVKRKGVWARLAASSDVGNDDATVMAIVTLNNTVTTYM